jgi:choline-sulfatase
MNTRRTHEGGDRRAGLSRSGLRDGAVLLVLLGFAFVACSERVPTRDAPVVYDFIEHFRVAALHEDTAGIDFGTPAARRYLIDGWSRDHQRPDGSSYVRGVGAQSVLEFSRATMGDLVVVFQCAPLGASAVVVTLNGELQRRVKLARKRSEYGFVLRGRHLRPGTNRLTFRYGFGRRRPPPGAAAVTWDYLRFGDERSVNAPHLHADPDTRELLLPVGSAVDYYLKAPGGSAVTFGGPVAIGGSDARLRLSVREDGAEPLLLAELSASRGEQRIALPWDDPRIIRLSFSAVGDGAVDADTVTLTAPALRASECPAGARAAAEPRPAAGDDLVPWPNIIIYLVDTLRRDHLGCYGYPKPVSPNIDALAREGVLFEHAICQSSWTKPAVASVFTGVWPGTHNVVEENEALPDAALTLAEILWAAGFRTAAFVANGHVNRQFAFDQGFDDFVFFMPDGEPAVPPHSDVVSRSLLQWLDAHHTEHPFFLYVHTVDPHDPYAPPPDFRSRFAGDVHDRDLGSRESMKRIRRQRRTDDKTLRDLVALYDAEIAFNDHTFGQLIATLERMELYDDTLIVFMADHGEEFRDHNNWGHGQTLYGESLDLPLVVKFPSRDGWRGRRVTHLAQHIDVLPTILDYLGLPIPSVTEGQSLLPAIRQDGARLDRRGFAHLDRFGRRRACVVDGPWKLIRTGASAQARFELYNRELDRHEETNEIKRRPVIAGYLTALLREKELRKGERFAPPSAVIDEKTRESLRALGYVE